MWEATLLSSGIASHIFVHHVNAYSTDLLLIAIKLRNCEPD